VLRVEAFTKGVDRTCPDIAEHNAECGDAQRSKPSGRIPARLPEFLLCG